LFSPPSYNPHDHYVFPVLLLARRAVEEAWECAKKRFIDGEPSDEAVEALTWILDDLDWTRLRRADGSVPIPPREMWGELYFSFDWCCRLLEIDPAVVREEGLPSSRLYHENPTVGGVSAVYAVWAEQRSAWLRKQSEQNLAPEVPLASTFAPEAVGAAAFD
jgi:hypothetical protein